MKLRILTHYAGPSNCMADSPHWSWAVRELGAEIAHYRGHVHDFDKLCVGADVVVYMAVSSGPDAPTDRAVRRARQHCRLIALLGDGGCPLGQAIYKRWRDEDLFDAVVPADGVSDIPHRPGKDFTAWGFFDPEPYERKLPRVRRLGMNCANHRVRQSLVTELGDRVVALLGYDSDRVRPYQEYVDWMLGSRAVINTSWTSYAWRKTCKGRVNEAALAGCLLFETGGSLTGKMFVPDDGSGKGEFVEYGDYSGLEYVTEVDPADGRALERDDRVAASMERSAQDIVATLNRPDFDDYAEAVGANMKARLLRDYGPEKFWRQACGPFWR